MLGHHQHASETQFKWCFPGGPMTALLVGFGSSPTHQLVKRRKRKNDVKAGPPLTKHSGSAHDSTAHRYVGGFSDCTQIVGSDQLRPQLPFHYGFTNITIYMIQM